MDHNNTLLCHLTQTIGLLYKHAFTAFPYLHVSQGWVHIQAWFFFFFFGGGAWQEGCRNNGPQQHTALSSDTNYSPTVQTNTLSLHSRLYISQGCVHIHAGWGGGHDRRDIGTMDHNNTSVCHLTQTIGLVYKTRFHCIPVSTYQPRVCSHGVESSNGA